MRYTHRVTIALDKTDLRRRLRILRRRLAASTPDAADRAAHVLPLDALPPFAIVSGYLAQGSELDALPIMRRLAAAGAQVALPASDSRDGAMVFRAWDLASDLTPDAFGIPAPPAEAAALQPDLIITPLLAFDRRGGRLGQGAGVYDRALENLRREKAVFVLGLAYSGQELPAAPLEPHDQPLDAILTETEFIAIARGV